MNKDPFEDYINSPQFDWGMDEPMLHQLEGIMEHYRAMTTAKLFQQADKEMKTLAMCFPIYYRHLILTALLTYDTFIGGKEVG